MLVSSAGRRVELLRGFRRALASLGLDGRVIATDASWYSSAFHDADEAFLVPRLDSGDYVPALLALCEKQQVDLVVPTIDTEMAAWVEGRDQFTAIGTTVALSGAGVVDIAADKQLTHEWLVANGFPTVGQASPEAVLDDPDAWPFPLIAKPRFGSAGIGVGIVRDAAELAVAVGRPELGEMVVQTLAPGREHTIDVLADRARALRVRRAPAPHRGALGRGEQGRDRALAPAAGPGRPHLRGAARRVRHHHRPGVRRGDGAPAELAVIEINARYGGGFPLALEAGADFPRWQLEELLGLPSTAAADGWRDGLVMLRYDAAVFVDEADAPA